MRYRPNATRGRKASSFRPLAGIGGATGIRTPDLYNAIVALSQLSYDPKKAAGERAAKGEFNAKPDHRRAGNRGVHGMMGRVPGDGRHR